MSKTSGLARGAVCRVTGQRSGLRQVCDEQELQVEGTASSPVGGGQGGAACRHGRPGRGGIGRYGGRSRVRVGGQETILGWVPKAGDLDLSGLHISAEQVDAATRIDLEQWRIELESQGEFFDKLGKAMPRALELYRQMLLARIEATQRG